jgi:hypothetical protein
MRAKILRSIGSDDILMGIAMVRCANCRIWNLDWVCFAFSFSASSCQSTPVLARNMETVHINIKSHPPIGQPYSSEFGFQSWFSHSWHHSWNSRSWFSIYVLQLRKPGGLSSGAALHLSFHGSLDLLFFIVFVSIWILCDRKTAWLMKLAMQPPKPILEPYYNALHCADNTSLHSRANEYTYWYLRLCFAYAHGVGDSVTETTENWIDCYFCHWISVSSNVSLSVQYLFLY